MSQSSTEGREDPTFMLKAMQQQFERMGVVFNEIRDRMDRQEAVIATWREGHPQRVQNARRQERHVPLHETDEDEFDNDKDQASMSNGGRFEPRRERRGRGFQRDPRWQDGVEDRKSVV